MTISTTDVPTTPRFYVHFICQLIDVIKSDCSIPVIDIMNKNENRMKNVFTIIAKLCSYCCIPIESDL